MSSKLGSLFILTIFMLFLISIIPGCRREAPLPLPDSPTATTGPDQAIPIPASPEPSLDTPVPAVLTPRPEPAAIWVNGEAVLMAEYQAEMALYLDSGLEAGEGAETRVVEELINQVLLAQAAYQEGFLLDDEALNQRLQALAEQAGGQAVLDEWMEKYGYSQPVFEKVLRRAAAAAWMRDRIIETVPERIEQVRVRQLIFSQSTEADQTLANIRAGTNFASLAVRQDPVLGGDLGWFPRGYLQESVLEEAAFALETGEFSEVIETPFGYHILQLVERNPQRPLDQEARLVLQTKALGEWLRERFNQSEIEISLP
jgi:peptidyl-prolyl cis-trans isomerase C